MTRRPAAATGLVGVAVLLAATAGGAQDRDADAFTFFNVRATADGVTADFDIEGFLPIEDLVGVSSVTSEAQLGLARSSALAALPDPGNVVLTLPGTLSALAGISGIPDYPAAALAEHPATPHDEVVFAPDLGLGAGTLVADAADGTAAASAAITDVNDAIGLLPSFSIGSARTTATTRRLGDRSFEAVATTTLSDLRLLGGLVRIDQITSSVTTAVIDGVFSADASEVDVSGATVAGTPVGVTEEGIVGLGQPEALAPLVDRLLEPVLSSGLRLRTTPASTEITDQRAEASGGTLEIEMPLSVSDYPGAFVLTVGRATSSLEAGGGAGGVTQPPASAGAGTPTTVARPIAPSPVARPATGGLGASAAPVARPASNTAASTGGQQVVVLPADRIVADWDVRDLYRAMALAGLAMVVAGRLVRRFARPPGPGRGGSDLRHLWRW